jgi:hypothetical protein
MNNVNFYYTLAEISVPLDESSLRRISRISKGIADTSLALKHTLPASVIRVKASNILEQIGILDSFQKGSLLEVDLEGSSADELRTGIETLFEFAGIPDLVGSRNMGNYSYVNELLVPSGKIVGALVSNSRRSVIDIVQLPLVAEEPSNAMDIYLQEAAKTYAPKIV